MIYAVPLLLLAPALQDDSRQIQTDRPSKVDLPLPEEDDAFVFAVFGDRTGGPDEGVKVLAQAVEEVNLVDPDLVMTVGDLINGYNQTPEWMGQMREYKEIMGGLSSPWFPVAGNHDVYWRGEGRPEGEHDANYEAHFGPLWYAFEHKGCWFISLYTDEGNPKTGEKTFGKPECQQMSPEQFAFLDRTLDAAAGARHVFVFLHHPRWHEGRYGQDWRRVHARLAEAGNVRAVFAGHIHRMVYDGPVDGIEYFTLATVGANQRGTVPEAGYLHHWNLVTVREEGISCATFPVGAAIDPRTITRQVSDEARTLAQARLSVTSGPTISGEGGADGSYEFVLRNPIERQVEASLGFAALDSRWGFLPDHVHLSLAPGEERRFAIRAMRRKGSMDSALRLPEASLQLDMLTEDTRFHLPVRSQVLPLSLESISPPATNEDLALSLDGKGAHLRVDHEQLTLPDGPFTVECRLRARSFAERTGLICKTESSEFGIFVNGGTPEFIVHLNGEYVSAKDPQTVLPTGQWVHLAAIFDGTHLELIVDGELVARTPGSGKRTVRAVPLLIGADTTADGRATSPFDGELDDVRISLIRRYGGDLSGIERTSYGADSLTSLMLHMDQPVGLWVYDHSTTSSHPRILGGARLVPIE